MSELANTALVIALGGAGGYALWRLTRKEGTKAGTPTIPPATTVGTTAPLPVPAVDDASPASTPQPIAEPPRLPSACSLKLDAKGLTADGERVNVATAVSRCRPRGRAELVLAPDAPAAIYSQLTSALKASMVPLTVKVV